MADTASYAGAMKIKYVGKPAPPAKRKAANARAARRRVKRKSRD